MQRKPLSKKTRFQVLQRDNFTCQYCGRSAPNVSLEVDHVVPVAKGGTNDIENLVTSCWECNIGKGTHEVTDTIDWWVGNLVGFLEDETDMQTTRTVHEYLKCLTTLYSWEEVDNALIVELDRHFTGNADSFVDILRRLPINCYIQRKRSEKDGR